MTREVIEQLKAEIPSPMRNFIQKKVSSYKRFHKYSKKKKKTTKERQVFKDIILPGRFSFNSLYSDLSQYR